MRLRLIIQCIGWLIASAQDGIPRPRATNSTGNLVQLSATNAVCLDGSNYSYYFSAGSFLSGYLFHHQGGGWCQTIEECLTRSLIRGPASRGSSNNYKPTIDLASVDAAPGHGGFSMFNRDKVLNPLFYNWNFVYLPYCDGGSFTGDSSSQYGKYRLQFRGKRIREAVVAHLKLTAGLASATDVVISGASAGGLAAFLHTDWYGDQLPGAKLRGMPDSGWFLNGHYSRDKKKDYETRMTNMYQMINATAGLNQNCVAKRAEKCLFAVYAIEFIRTPMFIINSKFDASMADGTYIWNESNQDQATFNWFNYTSVNVFGDRITDMTKAAVAVQPSKHAVFLDSCYRHTGQYSTELSGFGFGDLSPPVAMKLWYDGGNSALPNGGFVDQGQAYPCKSCCATTTPTMAPTALPVDCAAALSKACGQARHDGGVRVCKGCCDAHADVLNKTCTVDEWDAWCATT